MTIQSLCNSMKPVSTTETTLYTAQTNIKGVLITKFVSANDTGAASAYTVKIYSSSGSLVSAVQPFRVVNRYKSDFGNSVSGCVIPPGGSLKVQTAHANVLAFTVAGDV